MRTRAPWSCSTKFVFFSASQDLVGLPLPDEVALVVEGVVADAELAHGLDESVEAYLDEAPDRLLGLGVVVLVGGVEFGDLRAGVSVACYLLL